MQRGGVLAAAAPTLAAAAPPGKPTRGGKKQGKPGDVDWKRNNEPVGQGGKKPSKKK